MFLVFGGGPIFSLIIMFFVMRMAARQCGWGAVLLGALAVPFAAVAFWTVWFPETQILTVPALVIACLLIACACASGHSYLPNRARRIVERQNRVAEWQWAENVVGTKPMLPRYNSVQEDWAAYAQRDAAKEAKLRMEPTFRSRRFT
jgi:hypothetical protein